MPRASNSGRRLIKVKGTRRPIKVKGTRRPIKVKGTRRPRRIKNLKTQKEDVKQFIKEILDEIGKEIKQLDNKSFRHCFRKGKMCDECWEKKQPLMRIEEIIKQKAGDKLK